MNMPYIPVRKEGQLPGKCLKYKSDIDDEIFELQEDVVPVGSKVLIVCDHLKRGQSM